MRTLLAFSLLILATPAGAVTVSVARAPSISVARPSAPARAATPAPVKPAFSKPAAVAIGAGVGAAAVSKPSSASAFASDFVNASGKIKVMTHGATDDVEGYEAYGCDVDLGC